MDAAAGRITQIFRKKYFLIGMSVKEHGKIGLILASTLDMFEVKVIPSLSLPNY